MEYFIDAVKNNYVNFNGRARRKAFWMFMLVYFVISIVASVIDSILGMQLVSLIVTLALLLPTISISTRRLHDTGRSGWWQLIGLIPLIGAVVLIVFYVQDSHDENEYGVNPKGVSDETPAV